VRPPWTEAYVLHRSGFVAALASDTAWATAPVTASAGKFRPTGNRRGRGYAVMTNGNAPATSRAGVVLVGDLGQVLL